MNAIESNRKQSQAVESIMHDHEALREKIHCIHSVLAGPSPLQSDIEELLREFMSALLVHFAGEEEAEGFFAEMTKRAPRLKYGADKLCLEHRELAHEAQELCRYAASGCPSMVWWRELRSRCHAFSVKLMQHECQENKLLHEAQQVDFGVCD